MTRSKMARVATAGALLGTFAMVGCSSSGGAPPPPPATGGSGVDAGGTTGGDQTGGATGTSGSGGSGSGGNGSGSSGSGGSGSSGSGGGGVADAGMPGDAGGSDERFIGAPSVMVWRRPPMNCDVEQALAAYHGVASHYGDLSVMRKG
jgi:hypothetical protein